MRKRPTHLLLQRHTVSMAIAMIAMIMRATRTIITPERSEFNVSAFNACPLVYFVPYE